MRHATFHNAASAGTARRGNSTDLRHRLLLHMASRRRGAGRLSAGFTLIELMIVIVIVGILSAIAIPSFLAQTEKAKATEGKSTISAVLKQAHAEHQENPAVPAVDMDAEALTTAFKSPADGETKFDYEGATVAGVFTVTATTNANFGTAPTPDNTISGCVNLTSGKVDVARTFGEEIDCAAAAEG